MNKISCDICLDLMPLVKDGVASKDSEKAVREHITECKSCYIVFNEWPSEMPKINDRRVLEKIRKQLSIIGMGMIVIGILVGIGISESAGMFYNILIMPTIGIIGYFILGKKAYYVPSILFIIVYLWHFIKYIDQGIFDKTEWLSAIVSPAMWGVIYSGFCAVGILIAFLIYIAFKREEK